MPFQNSAKASYRLTYDTYGIKTLAKNHETHPSTASFKKEHVKLQAASTQISHEYPLVICYIAIENGDL